MRLLERSRLKFKVRLNACTIRHQSESSSRFPFGVVQNELVESCCFFFFLISLSNKLQHRCILPTNIALAFRHVMFIPRPASTTFVKQRLKLNHNQTLCKLNKEYRKIPTVSPPHPQKRLKAPPSPPDSDANFIPSRYVII